MRIFKLFTTVLFCYLFFSCTNDKKERSASDSISTNENVKETPLDVLSDIPWTATLDSTTQQYTMVRNEPIKGEVLDITNVLEAINRKYPENKLVFEKQNADTVFVKVENATYLTQASGSTGARVFLAESTYSLTEIPSIRVVFFNFKIGDHATPGAYTRKNFDFDMP
ncbi:hypothetical protein Pedsa_0155 [Pseudopedobacter saltans DSM 12145]|uniref:Uncharacterized protein n=1 Tax=Pseudopedobacter saltans (strain ATCC 51119 / DSM 12145 / JCM 21818 / CCUG 39354 / LMG 10337 / NBRC 100064 / NCIMB 13643) TaxID=762903 RepID=F0SDL4_PSESL|nr:hypothetical protein [Pseudopedobacter saltans]ADY50741.1 hypothetical protein Pedsa_0155 [Pseudopedobacter saltans DSM 12145]